MDRNSDLAITRQLGTVTVSPVSPSENRRDSPPTFVANGLRHIARLNDKLSQPSGLVVCNGRQTIFPNTKGPGTILASGSRTESLSLAWADVAADLTQQRSSMSPRDRAVRVRSRSSSDCVKAID